MGSFPKTIWKSFQTVYDYERKQDSVRPSVDSARLKFARKPSPYYGMSVDSTKGQFSEACQGRV